MFRVCWLKKKKTIFSYNGNRCPISPEGPYRDSSDSGNLFIHGSLSVYYLCKLWKLCIKLSSMIANMTVYMDLSKTKMLNIHYFPAHTLLNDTAWAQAQTSTRILIGGLLALRRRRLVRQLWVWLFTQNYQVYVGTIIVSSNSIQFFWKNREGSSIQTQYIFGFVDFDQSQ